MTRKTLVYGAAVLGALGLAPATSFAAGPCSNEIAQLGKQLTQQTGLGAPVSEPGAGEDVHATSQQSTTSNKAATAGSAASDNGNGNAKLGASAGTAGGVAGTVGAAAGTETARGIANGAIATSPEDVRRQSEGLPTQAQQAAERDDGKGGKGSATEKAVTKADKVSMAKSDLQKATDLSAKGDKSCMTYIRHAESLMNGT